jgi:hypothetical protein
MGPLSEDDRESERCADAPGGSIVSRDDKNLPPWTGDPEQMQAWVNAKLDALDAAFDRKMVAEATAWLKAYAPPRSDQEERRRKLLNKRALREADARQEAETKNLEPLRKLHPGHARFINLPPSAGGANISRKRTSRRASG